MVNFSQIEYKTQLKDNITQCPLYAAEAERYDFLLKTATYQDQANQDDITEFSVYPRLISVRPTVPPRYEHS